MRPRCELVKSGEDSLENFLREIKEGGGCAPLTSVTLELPNNTLDLWTIRNKLVGMAAEALRNAGYTTMATKLKFRSTSSIVTQTHLRLIAEYVRIVPVGEAGKPDKDGLISITMGGSLAKGQ